MADFDAGSIEGRLDLDTNPFERGLQKARAEAAEFERKRITRTVEYNTDLPPEAQHLRDQSVTIDANDGAFRAKLAEDKVALEAFDHSSAHADIDVDTHHSVRTVGRLRDALGRFRSEESKGVREGEALWKRLDHAVNNVAGFYSANSDFRSGGLLRGHGLMMLVGLAASLAPAFGPATAAVGLFGAAAAAGFGGAAISMGLYAKVASGLFEQIKKADAEGKHLSGSLGELQTALHGLKGAWDRLQKDAAPGIAKTLTPVFAELQKVIPRLLPLINSISTGLQGAFTPIQHLLESGTFDHFLKLLSANAIKDLPQIGSALAHGLGGLMHLFSALNPFIQMLVSWLPKITAQFERWAHFQAPAFLGEVFDTVQKYGPTTVKMFAAIGKAIIGIARDFAPLTGPALHFLTALGRSLGQLDLSPFTSAIGKVLRRLGPFLHIIATLANILLPALGTILGTIADGFIGPLGHSLASGLTPAFQALADTLDLLAPFIGEIVNSFADLVNPTGVSLLTKLVLALKPAVDTMIPPLAHLVLALERVVDRGLKDFSPLLMAAADGLGILATALAPVIEGLAKILDNRVAADIIFGLIVGIKGYAIAASTLAAVTGIIEAIQFGWAGLAVAQDASTVSLLANRAAMIAYSVATKIAAAAQWLLNVAMDANPIGLIIIAIAALAIGIYEAYKHSETFRNIVQALWSALKAAGAWIASAAVATWHALGAAIQWAGHAAVSILHGWNKVMEFFKAMPGKIGGWFADAGRWLLNAGSAIIHGLWNGLQAYWRTVWGFYSTVGSKVKGWFTGAAGWLVSIGSSIIHGLWNGLQAYWHVVWGFYSTVGSKIKGWFGGAIGWLYDVGWNIIQGLWNGLSNRFDSLMSWASDKISSLVGLFHKIPGVSSPAKRLIYVGEMMGAGLGVGLADSFERHVIPTAKDKMGRLMGTLRGEPRQLAVAGATAAGATDPSVMLGILGEIRDRLGSTGDQTDTVDALTEAFTSALTNQTTQIITKIRSNR